MIYTVFAAAALSFWFLRRLRREMTTQNRTARFSFLLVENALKFLRPFIAVTLFYVALSLALSDYDSTTIAVLRTYEESLGKVKDFLKLIGLTLGVSLIVLVGAFAFTLFADAVTAFRPYKIRIERLHTVLEKYHKIVGRGGSDYYSARVVHFLWRYGRVCAAR